jgi:membrane protease subunit (stomatin/prohibitin family)
MNIFGGGLKRQFIARPDAAKGQIVYKWPDASIPMAAQLTVEPDEVALFVREGKVMGVQQPGLVTLEGKNIPFLDMLIDAGTGGNFFKAELFFVSTREFANLPFGGVVDNVVDPETGLAIGLRVFGDYSLKVVDPTALILNLVGSRDAADNALVTDWMRDMVLKTIRTDVVTHIVANNWPILGIAAHTDDLEAETIAKVETHVSSYGVHIVRMGNFTISINDTDEETLKKYRRDVTYSKLAGGFQQYGAGEAMIGLGEGAAKGGGAAGNAFLGMGVGLGNLVGAMNQQAPQAQQAPPQQAAAAPAAPAATAHCTACGSAYTPGAKFCANCGGALPVAPAACPSCGTAADPGAKFCAGCGTKLGS